MITENLILLAFNKKISDVLHQVKFHNPKSHMTITDFFNFTFNKMSRLSKIHLQRRSMLALLRGLVKQLHLSATVVKNNCVLPLSSFSTFLPWHA